MWRAPGILQSQGNVKYIEEYQVDNIIFDNSDDVDED